MCIKSCITSLRSNEVKNKFERKQISQLCKLSELQLWIFLIFRLDRNQPGLAVQHAVQTARDTDCATVMAASKSVTVRKFLSKKGKGQWLTVNFKANKNPIQRRLILYINIYMYDFCTLKASGFYYRQASREMLCPTSYKPVATFWTIQSKYLCFLGQVSAIFRKEKEKQIKTEFMNTKQFLETRVPPPSTIFFFLQPGL